MKITLIKVKTLEDFHNKLFFLNNMIHVIYLETVTNDN